MEDAQAQLLVNIHQEIVSGTFSDLQIICNDGTTSGSRIVLAAMSPFFHAMFTSDMSESNTGVLNLPSVSSSTFKDILKMYLCKIDLVNENNCMQVIDAAEMMQLDHIKHLCKIYLKDGLVLTNENCLSWWRFTKPYNLLDFFNRVLCFLTDNLADFVQTENVVHLSKAELLEIISKNDFECEEAIILKGVMKWIEHNKPDADDVIVLFENVRLENVDSQFLINEVLFSDIVCSNKPVQQKIQQVLSLHYRVPDCSRLRSQRPDVFVLHHNKTSLLSCFTSDDKWEDVPKAPVDPGIWYSAARLGDNIYITGGNMQPNCTLMFDSIRKLWTVGPRLTAAHFKHCMATARSKVYAIGGEYSNTIEQLSEHPSAVHWQVVGDLGQARCHCFHVTVDDNIFILGGRIGEKKSDVIQCFNTRTRSLSQLDTHLPYRSMALRGHTFLPDVYLLDNEGNVMHMQVTNTDGEIKIEIKSTAKWLNFDISFRFGVVHRDGGLLCFAKDGIRKFNLTDNREDDSALYEPPRNGEVWNILG
ncbi:kelch-like protein 10 [Gigantopelta aegis]|uniref:kelch-like protein 10 n=1 Tax=Gigantopelta aegis TaxID=1735272 RepID=UPI001B887E6A|nr:kelch-like protein 10 [Gigantopelta aegis]